MQLFIPEKFDFRCDLWQDVEHCTLQQAHCTANHAVNCKNPTDLTRCDPHEYYQVNYCCSVSNKTAWYAWFVAIDNTTNLEYFLMYKKQHILKHKQLFFNRTICEKEDLMFFFSLKFKLSWHNHHSLHVWSIPTQSVQSNHHTTTKW